MKVPKFTSTYFSGTNHYFKIKYSDELVKWINNRLKIELKSLLGFNPVYPMVYLKMSPWQEYPPQLIQNTCLIKCGLGTFDMNHDFTWRWYSKNGREISINDTQVDDLVLEIIHLDVPRLLEEIGSYEQFPVPQVYSFPVEVQFLRYDPLIIQAFLTDFSTLDELKKKVFDHVSDLQNASPYRGVIHNVRRERVNKKAQTVSFNFDFGSADPETLFSILRQLEGFHVKKVVLHSGV